MFKSRTVQVIFVIVIVIIVIIASDTHHVTLRSSGYRLIMRAFGSNSRGRVPNAGSYVKYWQRGEEGGDEVGGEP